MPPNPPLALAGLMMRQPLLVSSLLRHAARHFATVEIVSRRVEGDVHRYTYADCHRRCQRLAHALAALGVRPGQRVATLAWNGYRHLELYYAVSGTGSVVHTVNPRLHADQIAYLLNHADDQYVFFDVGFLPLLEAVAARCPGVRGYVALCGREDMPSSAALSDLLCYEDLLAAQPETYDWPALDEESACGLCYTSGTTGQPKGVLYSHRSTVLHAYAVALPDALNLSSRTVVLPAVPMFHVNAWGIPYAAPLAGCKLVLPGPALDGASLHALIKDEGVTSAAGVPTVWLGLLAHAERNSLILSGLRHAVIGGAACPPALLRSLRDGHGVEVLHAWGMTELSPLGTTAVVQRRHLALPEDKRLAILGKQGHAVFGIDMKITDGRGDELPWDGKTRGELLVRGPWVMERYFGEDYGAGTAGAGWFATGDVATIDADGYMQIVDRSKDVIKSGGEWISSVEIEHAAMEHPGVQQAACIAIAHPKWDERPLLLVVPRDGAEIGKQELLRFIEGRIAQWWMPDDVLFVPALPLGATGKVLKKQLREQYGGYRPAAG